MDDILLLTVHGEDSGLCWALKKVCLYIYCHEGLLTWHTVASCSRGRETGLS
jgi:hypothetical protein